MEQTAQSSQPAPLILHLHPTATSLRIGGSAETWKKPRPSQLVARALEERIELVVEEEKRKAGGISLAVGASLVVHTLLVIWFVRSYKPERRVESVPIARYVELIKQNPETFTEAPGPRTDTAPLTAPLSDANRRASAPEPTGDRPTNRPGDGSSLYTPPTPKPGAGQPSVNAPSNSPQDAQRPSASTDQPRPDSANDPLIYREPVKAAAASGAVDWRSAIRDVRKIASLGGEGLALDTPGGGGEKGFADQGPLSFESQWYDWGEYAQSMVSRIRVNWYANMPQIIHSGLQGVVTIRFTIHRDGQITDVTILKSSGVPPYDFAARKAIELSSPLNRLPEDFPRPYERVTAMFYYNTPLPGR